MECKKSKFRATRFFRTNLLIIPISQNHRQCLDLSTKGFTSLVGLTEPINIRELGLNDNELKTMYCYTDTKTPCLVFFPTIKISLNKLELKNIRFFPHCTYSNVRFLYFDPNEIESSPVIPKKIFHLQNIVNLKILVVDDNNLTSLTGIETITTLEELNARNNNLVSLNGIQTLKNLKILFVPHNKILSLTEIANLKNLKEFDISENKPPLTTFAGLENSKSLEKLTFYHKKFSKFSNAKEWNAFCKKIKLQIVDMVFVFYGIFPPYIIMEIIKCFDNMDQWMEISRTNLVLDVHKKIQVLLGNRNKIYKI